MRSVQTRPPHTVTVQLTVTVEAIGGDEAAEDDVTYALAEEIGALAPFAINPERDDPLHDAIYKVAIVERD